MSASTAVLVVVNVKPEWKRVWWLVAQFTVLAATLAIIAGLVVRPTGTLGILWNLLVPILPATFLISPKLWRGICPLASLNQWFGSIRRRPRLNGKLLFAFNIAGIILLLVMVPARRFIFNENGPALAITIAAVAVLALILGLVFDRRAGFCNGVCPVLPVERLYGQQPIMDVDNRRCDKCTACIQKGCLDLIPAKSLSYAVDSPNSGELRWLTTSYGILAAGFPGFIVGYFTTSNVALSDAPSIYLWIAFCMFISYAITFLLAVLFGPDRHRSTVLLAAAAVGVYYWWAAPLITQEILLSDDISANIVRALALGLVAFWLIRSWPHRQALSA